MMFPMHNRAFAFAPLLAAVALITACDDDPVAPPDPAEAVEVMRLTIGTETIDLGPNDDAEVTIPLGATNVTAIFLDGDGNEVQGLDEEFELAFEFDAGEEDIVTFERSAGDPFAGTLTGESEGSAEVAVQLFHVLEGHEDLESFLNVTVE